jgi:pSer/pThr/pTyr-binding forkhead associated (FHA) protein
MDLRQFLEQHDRAKQLLLEGEHSPWLDEHVATCAVCGPLADRLAEIERMIADVPEPRPELLRRILGSRTRGDEQQEAVGRIEVLWPAAAAPRVSSRGTTLSPLVLAVDADRYPPDSPHARQVERLVVVGRHPIVLGRAPDVDVPVWDRSASRRHAQLDWRGDGWVIRDLESTNGTRVNGARVGNSHVTYLRPGDRIEIGHHVRLLVRTLLPALDPFGVGREIRRLLAGSARPAPVARGEERQSDELRARLGGLREETVQLRDELSSLARRGVDADALPMVYERLTNMLALLEQELLT